MSNHTPIQLPLAIEGLTVEIPLTKGYLAIVDAVDADLASLHWCSLISHGGRGPIYARRRHSGGGKKANEDLLHRVIYARILERALERTEQVDHFDLNGLNCRRDNLRLATNAQNCQNKPRRKDNRSGYKGVDFWAVRSKWRARITVNGETRYLGVFNSPEEAYQAYREAARELHSEFARFD